MPSRHIYVQLEYSGRRLGGCGQLPDHLRMAKRKHFLRQWRKHRGLSQVQLAERLHITQGHLSKIENHKKPWDEDLLSLAAEELRCDPVDILIRDPSQPEGIWSIWDTLQPVQQQQAVEVIKALKRTA